MSGTGGTGGGERARAGHRVGLRSAAALLVLTLGCSTVRTVPIERVPPQGRGATRVMMHDGYTYRFSNIAVRGDSLFGTYAVTEERIGPEGEPIFEDFVRQTALPVAGIARLEVRRLDPSKSILLGAGGVLFTIWLKQVFTNQEQETDDHGNSKPPQQEHQAEVRGRTRGVNMIQASMRPVRPPSRRCE